MYRLLLVALPLICFPWGAPGAAYIGSSACAKCHRVIYDRYIRTPMGRSITPVDAKAMSLPASVTSHVLGRDFSVVRRGDKAIQTESKTVNGRTVYQAEHELRYAIGSGENGISFAISRRDHLFQAPLSYFSKPGRWDISPGFESAGEGFNRPLTESCIVCHSGRSNVVPNSEGRYNDPPFSQAAIGCESCHGPGESHASMKNVHAIVNPGRLPSRVAEDICMQCHQAGDARVLLPGRRYSDFHPGERLLNTLAIVALPSRTENADLLEHHSSMQTSKCFRASQGKLSCLTCHDPHEKPTAAMTATYFNQKCLTCHSKASCALTVAVRGTTAPADNCIACHMPSRPLGQISHSTLTNHRIPRFKDRASIVPDQSLWRNPQLPGLRLMNDTQQDLALPLITRLAAYGELMSQDQSLGTQYRSLLDEARRVIPNDPTVLAAAGRNALQSNNAAEAVKALTAAEQDGGMAAVSYMDLSDALTQLGRQADSISALQRAEVAFPFNQGIRKRLILAFIRQKSYSQARNALTGYVQDFPEDDFMRGLLHQVVH